MNQAGVMLIINHGMILGVERRNKKGTYGLPGGSYDESLGDKNTEDTSKRECEEETGITVKDCTFLYERVELGDGPQGIDFYSRCYYATSWAGLPSSVEGLDVKWLTAEEITSTKSAFGEYNRKALDIFKQMFPNVYLKGE